MNPRTFGTPSAPYKELQDFTASTTEQQFLSKPLEQSYVFYRLVVFGEAMSRLAAAFQTKYPDLPWAAIISLRNRLVHAYFDLELPLVWRIAATQVDQIVERLRYILKTEFPEEHGTEP